VLVILLNFIKIEILSLLTQYWHGNDQKSFWKSTVTLALFYSILVRELCTQKAN